MPFPSRRPRARTLLFALPWLVSGLIACSGGGDTKASGKGEGGAWDPRTAELLFMSDRSGNADLFVMRNGDTAWVNLTRTPDNENWGEWSPDGKRILYQSRAGGRLDVWVMDADGSNRLQLTDNPDQDYVASWSPDGTRIAFTSWRMDAGDTARAPHVYLMNADGSEERRLVEASLNTSSGVSWSPDGREIVFSRGYGRQGADLWIHNLIDGTERRLTESEPYDGGAAYSPDGSQIAFYADSGTKSVIAVIGADGTGYREVLSEGQNWYPRWSPDGQWLVYTAAESVGSMNIDVLAVPAEGGTPIPLAAGPGVEAEGRWRP